MKYLFAMSIAAAVVESVQTVIACSHESSSLASISDVQPNANLDENIAQLRLLRDEWRQLQVRVIHLETALCSSFSAHLFEMIGLSGIEATIPD